MSVQTVRDFWRKVKDDAGLRQKLNAIQEKERQATVAAVVMLAADAGFKFAADEYDAAVKETLVRQHAAGELSEQQLAEVAGGPKTNGGDTAWCVPGGT
jgi:predicted ribosomally synthesized peptide with nif11-like leader